MHHSSFDLPTVVGRFKRARSAAVFSMMVLLSVGCVSNISSSSGDLTPCQTDGPWTSPTFFSDSVMKSIIEISDSEGSCRSVLQEWRNAEKKWTHLYKNPRGRYQLILQWAGNSNGNYHETWICLYFCPCCQSVIREAGGSRDFDE